MKEENKIKNKKTDFTKWAEKVEEVYGSDKSTTYKSGDRIMARELFAIKSKKDLRDKLDFSLDDPEEIIKASRTLHALDSNYAVIVSYFADMFYTRYTVTPEIIDGQEVDSEEYLEIYSQMLKVIDGYGLESLMSDVLREIFITGAAYLHAEENSASGTTTIRILPTDNCRTVFATNYGTNGIEFDFSYFDRFDEGEDLDQMLGYFPKEFNSLYMEYIRSGEEWQLIDPRVSTSILANEYSIPPLINALVGILEYDDTRRIELEKANRELQKILIHRIPIEDGMPIFDINEAISIQKAISKVTRNHKGLETITAFGETQLHELQKEGTRENKRIDQAYRSIFNSSGLNAAYFAETEKEALAINRSVNKGLVWNFIQKFNAFINLTVNQLYDFGKMQAIVKILPITIHEESEIIELYRKNASLGIGKLDAVVAAGVKQKDLVTGLRLEREIDLDNLLSPLKSSHTQSGVEKEEVEKDTVKIEKETKDPEEDEVSTEEVGTDEE